MGGRGGILGNLTVVRCVPRVAVVAEGTLEGHRSETRDCNHEGNQGTLEGHRSGTRDCNHEGNQGTLEGHRSRTRDCNHEGSSIITWKGTVGDTSMPPRLLVSGT